MAHPLFQLGARLQLCASFVRPGAKLADIGTDHAYLPIWLAKQEKISRGIAADVKLLPLQKAQRNIKRYRVQEVVSARLSDGLDQIFPHEADDIVMAGMGGELIARLVQNAPWLKMPGKQLVLQPMSSAQDLREFLAREGFALLREEAVLDEGRAYSVMLVHYAPKQVKTGPLYPYIGALSGKTEAGRAYIQHNISHLEKRAGGLAAQGDARGEQELRRVIQLLRESIALENGEETK